MIDDDLKRERENEGCSRTGVLLQNRIYANVCVGGNIRMSTKEEKCFSKRVTNAFYSVSWLRCFLGRAKLNQSLSLFFSHFSPAVEIVNESFSAGSP